MKENITCRCARVLLSFLEPIECVYFGGKGGGFDSEASRLDINRRWSHFLAFICIYYRQQRHDGHKTLEKTTSEENDRNIFLKIRHD